MGVAGLGEGREVGEFGEWRMSYLFKLSLAGGRTRRESGAEILHP